MITRFAHVCLNVKDIQKTIDFYNKTIGLPVEFTFLKDGRIIGVYFNTGGMNFIEAFENKNVEVVNTGLVHFCLETDNIDATIEEFASKGIPCTPKKFGCDRSWQTWIQDPDGNKIEIHEYTKESAQLNGGTIQVDW